MKVLSFSAVEILPALLDKSKTQTIRPAWEKGTIKNLDTGKMMGGFVKPKLARFKVGEKEQVMWKQRTSPKDSWFCKTCGELLTRQEEMVGDIYGHKGDYPSCSFSVTKVLLDSIGDNWKRPDCTFFPKILGIVESTDIFKIEFGIADFDRISLFNVKFPDGQDIVMDAHHPRVTELAERDGFQKPPGDGQDASNPMFEYFGTNYDLKEDKPFWVYRYKWVE